ncbi:DUF547 domain-containing protein [candidate division KSB1 bacterium]
MKKRVILIFCIAILILTSASAQKISHSLWDQLLKKYVNKEGKVNYKGFKDDALFQKYIGILQANEPESSWSRNEQLAYWINAYNAFTIKLIVINYPLKSIRDIENAWDKVFIKIEKSSYSLNDIEHNIIRKKFNEPRIHFALVCAAYSCPFLRNEPYIAAKLDSQLNNQAVQFINDPKRNKIAKDQIRISKVFSWFKDDFTMKGSLIQYLNKYSKVKINTDAKVEFLEYDWTLNSL